jgi:hypothetical protein
MMDVIKQENVLSKFFISNPRAFFDYGTIFPSV